MNKILIISHAMELGGVEKSLLGLLEVIDYSKYEIDLFLYRKEGELLDLIPKQVNLLDEIPTYANLGKPLKSCIKKGQLLLALTRTYAKLMARLYEKRHNYKQGRVGLEYSHKFTKWLMPKIQPNTEYDLAISFLTPHYIVAKKVNAKVKIGWIHTDYTKIDINRKSEQKMWNKLDYIISISNAVTDTFTKVFPALSNKIKLIENILPKTLIYKQTEETEASFEKTSVNLLSIGRFCTAKNFDNVPHITKMILDTGLNVKWYLIGYGNDDSLIRQKIKDFKMEENVIILGKKDNPYPYIKACDIYVQPSRFEGNCVAVREAQMLSKPVIITNYATASSQLEDGVDGVIVPMDNEGCAKGIMAVINDKDLQKKLSEECGVRDYSNSNEIEKIYDIIV